MRRRALAVLVALACGSPAKPIVATKPAPMLSATASASASASASVEPPIDPKEREHAPALGAESPLVMPHVEEKRLGNGLRLLIANTGGGMFAMRIVFEGYAVFPAERPAAVRIMERALFGGTPTHDAHALRRVLEKRFADWGTQQWPDATVIDLSMPADDIVPCIEVLADAVENPLFDQLTISFELLQLVEQSQTARDQPAAVSASVLRRALYGDGHIYARLPTVLDGSSSKLELAEVRRVYETVLDPSTTTIVLAGAVDHAVIDAVQKQFGSWRAHAHSAPTPVKVTWRTGPRLVVVDRPGSVQSEIAFGALTPTRASPDYFAMELVHQLLGAHRSSRLTRALVEGATHMDARRAEGNFYWQSSVPLARTATVLRQIDQQLKDLGQTPPSAEELDGTKARYIRQLPLWIETAGETAGAVQTIASYALPLDALDGIAPGIQSVTPDAIQKLAADRLSADHTRVVIVGDWSKLKADLKALAWGPIELRDASGKILRVER